MADKRNRSVEFIDFLASEGIAVNIGKNKALGNKGYFKAFGKSYRIDVAKGLSEEEISRVLLHEFAHYLHYKYDKTLKSLDFIIKDFDDEILEEMISLTVDLVSKEDAKKLFGKKTLLNAEIREITKSIKKIYPQFKISIPNEEIEKIIRKRGYAHLIKYDRVKILKGFSIKLLSIEEVDNYFTFEEEHLKQYLILKSKQRYLRRINSRISKLNRYYNSTTELFARSIEVYFTDKNLMSIKAKRLMNIIDDVIVNNRLPLLTKCSRFFL